MSELLSLSSMLELRIREIVFFLLTAMLESILDRKSLKFSILALWSLGVSLGSVVVLVDIGTIEEDLEIV